MPCPPEPGPPESAPSLHGLHGLPRPPDERPSAPELRSRGEPCVLRGGLLLMMRYYIVVRGSGEVTRSFRRSVAICTQYTRSRPRRQASQVRRQCSCCKCAVGLARLCIQPVLGRRGDPRGPRSARAFAFSQSWADPGARGEMPPGGRRRPGPARKPVRPAGDVSCLLMSHPCHVASMYGPCIRGRSRAGVAPA